MEMQSFEDSDFEEDDIDSDEEVSVLVLRWLLNDF